MACGFQFGVYRGRAWVSLKVRDSSSTEVTGGGSLGPIGFGFMGFVILGTGLGVER